MYKKLLVGFDGSAGARAALARAVCFVKLIGGEAWAIWVSEATPYFIETSKEIACEEAAAQIYFQKLKAEIEGVEREEGLKIHFHSQVGHAAEKIVRYALEGSFDLIVLGSHGHSALWRGLLGHTTDRISEQASCSVLIVRAQGRTVAVT